MEVAVALQQNPTGGDSYDPVDDEWPGIGLGQHDPPRLQIVGAEWTDPDAGAASEEGEHALSFDADRYFTAFGQELPDHFESGLIGERFHQKSFFRRNGRCEGCWPGLFRPSVP